MLAGIYRYVERSAAPAPEAAVTENRPAAASITAPPPQAAPRSSSPNPYRSASGITLQRQDDGHFYAAAKIQGTDIRFLVDTGATAVALTGDDAQRLGLYWNESELTKIGRGVSGDVFGKPVIIPSIQVGNLRAENVQAAIIPDGLDVSLLGQAFLSQVGNVNISDDKMTLQ